MQIVSLHEMSKPAFWKKRKKKNITSLPSAEFGKSDWYGW